MVQLFRPVINRRRHQIHDGGGRRRREGGMFETLEARQHLSAAKIDWKLLPPQAPPPATTVTAPGESGSGTAAPVKALLGLTTRVIGTHRITLNWPAVSKASGYQIRRRIGNGAWSVLAASTASTEFADTQLTEQTTYEYQVTALSSTKQAMAASSITGKTGVFKLFNSLSKTVDLSADGIPPLMTNGVAMNNGQPDLNGARRVACLAAGILMDDAGQPLYDNNGHVRIAQKPQNLVLDQENLDCTVEADRQILIQIITTIREEWARFTDHPEFKSIQIGLFANLPPAVPTDLNDSAAVKAWHAQSSQMFQLAQNVDFVLAIAYTDITDPSSFAARMSALIREAQQFGKPVYSFIWPEYIEQEQYVPANEQLTPEMWQTILDESRNESDGAIMWGQFHRFDPNDAWALITRKYLKQPLALAPAAPTKVVVDPVGLHLTWALPAKTSRVRVERSNDGGSSWEVVGLTAPGATQFDDATYVTVAGGFSPIYRVQAVNPYGSSSYVTSASMRASRDAFAVNHAYWADAKHPAASDFGPVITNLWPGRWIEFSNMSFRKNADHVEAVFRGGTLEVWLDCVVGPDGSLQGGTKVGSMLGRFSPGDSPLTWFDQSAQVNVTGGKGIKHNVFIRPDNASLIWVDWVRFGGANDPSAAPESLSATTSNAGVKLTWFDNSDDETGFRVERSSDDGMTWTVLPNAPANKPASPGAANSMVTYLDKTATKGKYTYRVGTLHGTGVNLSVVTDVISTTIRPNQVPFNADTYDRSVGINEQVPGELYHTELGASTHTNEFPARGAWVKYSDVDFGSGSNLITLNLAPVNILDASQSISFYIDRLDPANKIGSFVPTWAGGWGYYDDETLSINTTSGVHDLYMQFDNPNGGVSIRTIRIDHSAAPVPAMSATLSPTSNLVNLVWADAGNDISGCVVEWRKVATGDGLNPQDFIAWTDAPTDAATRAYTVSGLAANTQYEFRVVALTATGKRPSLVTRIVTGS